MNRINVYTYDPDEGRQLDGWFDLDKAEAVKESTRWDGNNHISVHGSDPFGHQILYRTSAGRYVLHNYNQRVNIADSYEFVTDEVARTWLLTNESDEEVQRWFGAIAEERGPGRPEVGKPINVRLGDALLARVDRYAETQSVTRAIAIRDLVRQTLDAYDAVDRMS